MGNKKFTIYAIDKYRLTNIEKYYITTSEERAKELFKKEYNEDCQIIRITFDDIKEDRFALEKTHIKATKNCKKIELRR